MSINTHLVAPEEVMARLDGELSADHARSVSAHLEECAECREVGDSLRGTSQSLSSWTVPQAPISPGFEGRLAETVRRALSDWRSMNAMRFGMFFRHHWLLTGMASVVAAIVLTLSTTSFLRPRNMPVDLARTDNAGVRGTIGKLLPPARPLGAPRTFDEFQQGDKTSSTVDGQLTSDQQVTEFSREAKVFAGPMIARTVSLSILVKDFEKSRASLDAVVARHHGYAAGLTASTQQNFARSLQASLRIPAGELTAAAAELKSLGRVENETQNGEEVTQQHADLVARLKNSRETEQRLQAILLQRTGKISDVLAVEQEIARVRGEIEQMEAEQKSLEHRVDFATVDLRLAEEYKAQLNSPSPSISTRLHNALVTGYRAAVETVVGIILFFAEVGPSLLVWLIFLFPIAWLLWRRWRRGYAIGASFSA
jgi:hypothetical protein